MKKLLSILILVIAVFACTGVYAKESYHGEIGPAFTEELLKNQAVPYEMRSNTLPSYYASAKDRMAALLLENVLAANTGEIEITEFFGANPSEVEIKSNILYSIGKIIGENPHVFYMKSYGYYIYLSGKITVYFEYSHTQEEILKMISETNKKVDQVCGKIITNNMTPLQKELAVHDYIVSNCVYDMENYENNTVPDVSHSAYGALCLNTAVCDGYSRAFKLFMDKFDIPCIIVTSDAMAHAWNIVNIGGNNYSVDATWNDTDDKIYSHRYNYFNIDDAAFSDHTWVREDYPVCTDTKYSYIYSLSHLTFPKTDNNYFYYRDPNDNMLIKMSVNSGEKQVLADKRAFFIVLHNDVLFFSDYSYSGHLYAINTSGENLTEKDNGLIEDIYIENHLLHYTQNAVNDRTIELFIPAVPSPFDENDIFIKHGFFADATSLPIAEIGNNKTVFAKIGFQNLRTNATARIFAVAFDDDNVISDIEAETIPLLPGVDYNLDLSLSTEGAKYAKLFIMYGFEPMAKPVIIEK